MTKFCVYIAQKALKHRNDTATMKSGLSAGESAKGVDDN